MPTTTIISYPETTSNLTLNYGDQEIVSSGGISYATIIKVNGATEFVSSGGIASGTIVSGGYLEVGSGGAASGSQILGGSEEISSGGSETGAFIHSGTQFIDIGGIATSITVSSGRQYVDGTTSDTTLVQGYQEVVGEADGTTIGSGSDQLVSGTAINTIINSGGLEEIFGTAIGTTINSGGSALIISGATISDLTVSSGGSVNEVFVTDAVSGLSLNTPLSTTVVVDSNAYEAGAIIGSAIVLSGGSTTGMVIQGGGYEVLSSGATTTGTILSSGILEVSSGAAASGTIVLSASTTLIEYPYENIEKGASETGATVGGVQYVLGTATDTTIVKGGYQYAYGTVSNTVVDSGGAQVVFDGTTAINTTINSGGVLSLDGFEADFEGLKISVGGKIEIQGIGNGSVYVTTLTSDGLLTLENSNGHPIVSVQLSGDYTHETFTVSQDSSYDLFLTAVASPCYCAGTMIMSDQGEIAVEALQIGDRILNYKGEARKIKWIGRRSYSGRFIGRSLDLLPICFRAGSLDEALPRRDLWVSPHHAMYLDGLLIEAKDLLNGISIYQAACVEKIEYFHIEFDSHDVIIAEGALAESFVDDNSRGLFHNARDYEALHPAERTPAVLRYCAPRVDSGEKLETIRSALEARAANFKRLLKVAI